MYRLLVFIALFSIIESISCCEGPECRTKRNSRGGNSSKNVIYKVEKQLNSCNRKLEKFCTLNTHVREVYGADAYTLKYTIKDFQPQDLDVKVINRIILVSAESRDRKVLKSYTDVRLLPDNMDLEEGSWTFQDGTLLVTLPFRKPLDEEIITSCGINDNAYTEVIKLPMVVEDQDNEEQGSNDQVSKRKRDTNEVNKDQEKKDKGKDQGNKDQGNKDNK